MEVFDNQLYDYLNNPKHHTENELESLECDLWNLSACCNAPIIMGLCGDCKEHTEVSCVGCGISDECINDNKVIS